MSEGFVSGKMGLNEFGLFAISVGINGKGNYTEHLLRDTGHPHGDVIDRAFQSLQDQNDCLERQRGV